jgi:hypothetical protein
MDNRIVDVVVTDYRLDPAESEVRIAVYPEHLAPGTEVRGRLMGPSNPYTSTVEIAYHLREVARAVDHIVVRAVIPEPCLWEPKSPFLYQGPLELWQDGQRVAHRGVSHGLRHVRLLTQELRVNGKTLTLLGINRAPDSEAQARELHERGINLLLPADPRTFAQVWTLADRYGFFMLARAAAPSHWLRWKQEGHLHASALGWAFAPLFFSDESIFTDRLQPGEGLSLARVGIELQAPPTQELPARVSFILCEEQVLPGLAQVALPKFVLGEGPPARQAPGVVGWIEAVD